MVNNIEDIRVIYIRALKHLLALVISIRSNTESELNEFITKDLEKFEGEIRQLKIQYEEGSHPPNTPLLCNALKSYKDNLERSRVDISNKLGFATPQFTFLNSEIQSLEAEITKRMHLVTLQNSS